MKILRNLITVLLLAFSTSVFAQNVITATEANITITGETTREGLINIRTELLAQGFDFRYVPQFDGQRRLLSLTYTITANDGALAGSGEHSALQADGAAIRFVMNKTNKTFVSNNSGQ